jgi:uncharacterized protein YkwD
MLRRAIREVLICLVLGGCATSSVTPSGPSVSGGPSEPARSAPVTQSAQKDNGSSEGGIWSNFSSLFSSGAQPASQKGGALDFDASAALRLVNNYRAAKGIAPLDLDPQATAAAEMLVEDMALHDRMSHTGPNGQDVGKRLLAAGYSYSIASENVGVGQATVEEAVAGWKASPGNSRNMLLAKAKHIGIAYENRPDSRHKNFWVLVVAAP